MSNAIGSELVIPENLTKSINEAEKKFKDLAKAGTDSANAIKTAFQSAAKDGIGQLVVSIKESITAFGKLTTAANKAAAATNKISTGSGGTGVGKVGQDAAASTASITQLTSAVDALRKSMDVMNAARSFINSDELKKAQANIADLQRQIAELKEQYASLQTTSKGKTAKVVSVDDAQKLADEAKTLGEMQQAIKALQSAQKNLNVTDEEGARKSQHLTDEIARLKEACKQATMTQQQLATAQEKEAAAAEKAAIKNADYNTAMAKASSATTINERTQAIKYLTEARKNLSTTDSQYAQKLAALNAKIKELNAANSAAVSGSKQLAASHSHLLNISGQLARSFALLFSVSQVRGYIAEIAKVRGQFEMTQRSLQAILNDTQKANQIFNKTLALAVQSPYSIKDLTKFVRQLAAYRIESDKLYDTTKRLADVAAGLGVDMQRIILAYGQIKAANFLKGTEVRQLTEAGVNIYSELQSYFAEVKGLEYTTADIVSMISKKKVTFEDVEAVFQRMTDKGGMFYNMQLIQSETLQGKIMKFRDSVDIMLNDIGKSTEGLMKGFLDSVTALMKNWRSIRNAAYALLVVLGGIWARKGWIAMQASITAATMRMAVLRGQTYAALTAMQKMTLVMKSFGTAIKTALGGWTGIGILAGIEVLSFAISRIMEVNREANKILKESNEHYGEQMRTVRELAAEYRKLTEAKEAANKAGTEIDEAKYLQDRRSKLIQLVEAMRKEGLDLDLEPFAINEEDLDATFDDAIERYKKFEGAVLRANEKIAESGKSWFLWGIFEDSANTDFEQYQKAADKVLGMTTKIDGMMEELAREDVWSVMSEEQKKEWGDINDLLSSDTDRLVAYTEAYQRAGKIISQMAFEGVDFSSISADLRDMYSAKSGLEGAAYEAANEMREVFSGFKKDILEIEDIAERKRFAKAIIDQLASVHSWGEEVQKLARRIAEEEFQIRFTVDEESLNDTIDWVSNYINDFLQEHEFNIKFSAEEVELPYSGYYAKGRQMLKNAEAAEALLENLRNSQLTGISRADIEKSLRSTWDFSQVKVEPEITYGMSPEDVVQAGREAAALSAARAREAEENLQRRVDEDWEKEKKTLENIGFDTTGITAASNDEIKAQLKAYKEAMRSFPGYLGLLKDEGGKGSSTNSILKERINLLKEMEERYEELRQVYSDAEAAQMTLAQYSDSIATSGLAQFLPAGYAPTKQGTADALRNLTGTAASQKDLTELLKDVAEYELKIKVDVEEESLKEAKDVVETAFSGYELFKDLQDTGLSEAAIKRMFPESGISTSLNDVADIIEYQMGGKEGTKWGDAYNEALQKLADEREKQAMEDMRDLINNYKEHLSDQLQLDIWYQQQRRKIENADFGEGNENIKERIRTNLDKEYQEKTNENTWNDFKGSDLYQMVFGNIEMQSGRMLDMMLRKVRSLKSSLKDLTPAQMRAVLEAETELENQIAQKNPIKVIKEGVRELDKIQKKTGKSVEQLREEYLALYSTLKSEGGLNEQVAEQTKVVEAKQDEYDAIMKNASSTEEERDAAKALLDAEKQRLALLQEQQGEVQGQADSLMNLLQSANSSQSAISSGVSQMASQVNNLSQAIRNMFSVLEEYWVYWTGDTSGEAEDFLSSLSEAMEGMETINEGASNFVQGYFSGNGAQMAQGIIQSVSGTIQAIGSIFKYGDKKLARKIEALQDEVDDLTRAYEKIEEALTLSITTSDISSNYLSGINNLKQQIADYEEMIELERAKKDTDEDAIKEYQEAIEDLEDQLEDYYNSYIEMLGGVSSDDFRSAAESFAEAWLDAFNEVEDTYDALIDNLQDYLNDMLVAQITNAASEQFIQPIIDSLNEMVEASGDITQLSKEDLDEWWSDSEDLLEQYNDFLEYYFNKLGISPSGSSDSSLSALQQGIQSITEETGAALESLLNSMRFYVATEQADVAIIKTTLLSMASSSTTTSASDPMLIELKAQTALLSSIDMRLSAVTKAGHPEGGRGLKVFMN